MFSLSKLSGFRDLRWADRYLAVAAAFAGFIGTDALLHGDRSRGAVWLCSALGLIAVAPRRFLVLTVISGFLALQATIFSVLRQRLDGIPFVATAALVSLVALKLSQRQKERWPEDMTELNAVQLAIDAAVYFVLLRIAIALSPGT